MTDQRFRARDLPADTAGRYLEEGFNARRYRAVLVFLAPPRWRAASSLATASWSRSTTAAATARGWTREWLAVTTTVLGIDVRVEEPVEFLAYRASLRDRLDRAASV